MTKYINEAADAMAALYVMDAVVGLLEGGAIKGGSNGAAHSASKIVKICKTEMQRQLARHDSAVDAAKQAKFNMAVEQKP